MTPEKARYALQQILFAAQFIATPNGRRILANAPIKLVPASDISEARGPIIVLPEDVASQTNDLRFTKVPFNGTELTLLAPLPRPAADWVPLPNSDSPAWWRHPSGTLTPSWNMLGVVYDLLTFREDAQVSIRDRHGRIPLEASARAMSGLAGVPVTNEALALLLDGAACLASGTPPSFQLEGLIEAPAVVFSHDCDLLKGSDAITQAIRVYRIFEPLRRGKPPKIGLVWTILQNFLQPYRFYLDDLTRMLDVEREHGFRSTMYILNGTGGRFGARSGRRPYSKLIEQTPANWEIGIHYNYDTFHEPEKFDEQRREIEAYSGQLVTAGRAHYLRFDPIESPEFVASRGIRLDESIGWTGKNGYRAGIAAPYHPLDRAQAGPLELVELPLMFMDVNVPEGEDGLTEFASLFRHLQKIGGVMSVLFHPGTYSSPERPHLFVLYKKIVAFLRSENARNFTSSEIVRIAADLDSDRIFQTEV